VYFWIQLSIQLSLRQFVVIWRYVMSVSNFMLPFKQADMSSLNLDVIMLTLLFFSWKLVHYYWFLTKSLASLWLFHFKHEVNCSDNYNCLIDKPLWHLFILNLNLFRKFWVEVNNCLDFKLVSWISNLCLPALCSWSIKYMPSWVPNATD